MSDTRDFQYLERRAEAELDAAQEAVHPAAVRAHYQLAALYLDALYRPADALCAANTSPLEGTTGCPRWVENGL
jgi:hypothetical protein